MMYVMFVYIIIGHEKQRKPTATSMHAYNYFNK